MKEETLTVIKQMVDRYRTIYEELEQQQPATVTQRLALRRTQKQIDRLEALFSAKNN